MLPEFKSFSSIPRLSRDVVITEKLDGTNAQIYISEEGNIHAGSRNRWITPADDNYGFARWVEENRDELMKLGAGHHYGEWWGQGIQINYGLKEKRFSLFNVNKWNDPLVRPSCCHVVPTVHVGPFNDETVATAMGLLKLNGSYAAPGFMKPEGIVIYHKHAGVLFKKTFEHDEAGKTYGS